MLVLTRKKGESIMLGNDIEVTIVSVDGDQIKLGINAPKQIEVHRKEIYLSIQQENQQAANQTISFEKFQHFFKEKNEK